MFPVTVDVSSVCFVCVSACVKLDRLAYINHIRLGTLCLRKFLHVVPCAHVYIVSYMCMFYISEVVGYGTLKGIGMLSTNHRAVGLRL